MKSPLSGISRELRSMLSEFIDEHGMRIEPTRGGHYRILASDGRLVTIVSKSASDHRAMMNARSNIRRFIRSSA